MALPWLGSLGQLLGLQFISRIHSLKKYTLTTGLIGRALWAIPLCLAIFWGDQAIGTGEAFPYQSWFLVVTFSAFFSSIFSSSSTVTWMAWMRSIISARFHGRFFSMRHQFIMGALILANLFASFIIDWNYRNLNAGFLILGFLGMFAGIASISILFKVHDTKKRNWKNNEAWNIRNLLSYRGFNRILIFSSVFYCAIFMAAPFFPYYFTKELKVSMSTVALWIACSSLGSFLAAGFWGRRIDRSSSVVTIIRSCALKLSLSPFLYLFLNSKTILWVAPFEYFMNGMAWSGFILALTTHLFRHCPRQQSPQFFSFYSAATSLSSAVGILVGGSLIHIFYQKMGFNALWITAGSLRFTAALFLIGLLKNQEIRISLFSKVPRPAWLSTQLVKQAKASSVEDKDSGLSASP
jgi:MFS family permease